MIHRALVVFFVGAVILYGTPQVRLLAFLSVLAAFVVAVIITLWSHHHDKRKK